MSIKEEVSKRLLKILELQKQVDQAEKEREQARKELEEFIEENK